MIKAIIIVNNQGESRIVKFYEGELSDEARQKIIRDCFSAVSRRSDNVCNFLEGKDLPYWKDHDDGDVKLVYRHYATLQFIFVVDQSESELGILDLIQVFVETLDKCFENVCELDLIFHSDKVHYILDEIVMAGMVLETNSAKIIEAITEMNKLEKLDDGKTYQQSARSQRNRNCIKTCVLYIYLYIYIREKHLCIYMRIYIFMSLTYKLK